MPDAPPIIPDALILPETTLFGRGKFAALPGAAARFGARGMLVYGAALEAAGLPALLAAPPAALRVLPYRYRGDEPTLEHVVQALEAARAHGAQWVAGVGGGSVLDLAKAVAGLFHAAQPPVYYHNGGRIETPGLPSFAVPTTAGTGSEVTVNSVLTNTATNVKKSIRDNALMPRGVILDPDLLATCPPPVIAASGLDALTQAIEAYTSRKASWLSDTLALKAVELLAANLVPFWQAPRSAAADAALLGSYFAGLALAFARLGVVHGLAHPLGGVYHVPHGLVCAALLPHALALNRPALGARYDALSRTVGGDLRAWLGRLAATLKIVSPFAGLELREREALIRDTLAASSTASNPKAITRADVEWLLDRLFERAGPASGA